MKSSYHVEFRQIPRQSKFHVFRETESSARHLAYLSGSRRDMCQAVSKSNNELKYGL